MLSFDSALSNSLKLSNTTSFWVLKLYYNDETNFIGVSEQDRQDGSDMYYGLVSSWGAYSQSLDFFNFTTSVGNMSVRLINTDMSFKGGRFSDDFATNNYANRKWELFQNTSGTSTYDTSARMIASGIISGDIKYDQHSISLTLLDKGSTYHKQLPTNVVDSTTYPNAPEKNIGKPIPMAYGDFHDKTDVGTIPTSGAEFDRHFTKSKFPSIISNEWSASNRNVEAKPDSVAIHTLDIKNVYIYKDGHYSACEDSNVTETESTPIITFEGEVWRVYINLFDYDGYDVDNIIDSNFDTTELMSSTSGAADYIYLGIPKITKLGKLIDIKALLSYGNFTGTANIWTIGINTILDFGTDNSNESVSLLSEFTADEIENWDFEGSTFIKLQDNFGTAKAAIKQVGFEIEFTPSQTFEKIIREQYEVTIKALDIGYDEYDSLPDEKRTLTRTKTLLTPTVTDYIYYSGKGRKYGTWINSRSTGYNTTLAIENPIFIIEEMLRTELGLSSATIDEDTFNTAGNNTNGDLGDIYHYDIDDVKFAFSQYKFINSKDLINRICKQILSWVYISGDGKFKIKTLKRSYSSSDKTIDYTDINLKGISRTSLGGVRNDISINYNHDYGQDQFLSNVNPTADATSEGTGVDGYNQTLKLEMDADTLDSTTATQLADAYQTIFKDRKIIIDFDCKRPKYNDLEIGDIIDFSNWDSKIKLYGTAMSGYFLISSIQKRVDGCSIKVIKV